VSKGEAKEGSRCVVVSKVDRGSQPEHAGRGRGHFSAQSGSLEAHLRSSYLISML
jgi:hypothetical protein